jgi:hypothetical protein
MHGTHGGGGGGGGGGGAASRTFAQPRKRQARLSQPKAAIQRRIISPHPPPGFPAPSHHPNPTISSQLHRACDNNKATADWLHKQGVMWRTTGSHFLLPATDGANCHTLHLPSQPHHKNPSPSTRKENPPSALPSESFLVKEPGVPLGGTSSNVWPFALIDVLSWEGLRFPVCALSFVVLAVSPVNHWAHGV